MAWHLAPSLSILQAQLNKRWPNRKKPDGTIGDTAHKRRKSSHNPNRRGSVNGIDISNEGIEVAAVIKAAMKHPSTWYVISQGFIYSRTYGFAKRRYTGSNPHNSHIHISILDTVKAENSTELWFSLVNPAPKPKPKVSSFPLPAGEYFSRNGKGKSHNGKRNPKDRDNVKRIQKFLGSKVTGYYGPITASKVYLWRKRVGLTKSTAFGKAAWDKAFPPS
jgi:peptidoglycan hydrolase-like protein with peptidoglycan-binding domain